MKLLTNGFYFNNIYLGFRKCLFVRYHSHQETHFCFEVPLWFASPFPASISHVSINHTIANCVIMGQFFLHPFLTQATLIDTTEAETWTDEPPGCKMVPGNWNGREDNQNWPYTNPLQWTMSINHFLTSLLKSLTVRIWGKEKCNLQYPYFCFWKKISRCLILSV